MTLTLIKLGVKWTSFNVAVEKIMTIGVGQNCFIFFFLLSYFFSGR